MVLESRKPERRGEVALPDKKYFKIGEASILLGVKPHVLRYWESEFPQIRPTKTKTGQRMYRRSDMESLVKIQKLLYHERFTIAGARQALRSQGPVDENLAEEPKSDELVRILEEGDAEMIELAEPEVVVEYPSNTPAEVKVALMAAKKELEALIRLVDEESERRRDMWR